MDKLRFPIGTYTPKKNVSNTMLKGWITTLEEFYLKLQNSLTGLTEQELKKTYRPNGWTIKQIVHHLADSHINAYIRFKLALTEDNPTIKPYNEASWAMSEDCLGAIEPSLKIIEGVHIRWVILLKSMTQNDFNKAFIHPEFTTKFDLKNVLALYDWHCRHHLAHIELAKK